MKTPAVPTSWGDLIDKITILEIKTKKIKSQQAHANVAKELSILSTIAGELVDADPIVHALKQSLYEVNTQLWIIEDQIRKKESDGDFDQKFIELARSVYKTNDVRATLKRRLNDHLRSEIVEEKSYQCY